MQGAELSARTDRGRVSLEAKAEAMSRETDLGLPGDGVMWDSMSKRVLSRGELGPPLGQIIGT